MSGRRLSRPNAVFKTPSPTLPRFELVNVSVDLFCLLV